MGGMEKEKGGTKTDPAKRSDTPQNAPSLHKGKHAEPKVLE
jgi:hypothetical protein